MDDMEKLELLKAALAVAAADGILKSSEMGVVEGLAARVGIGQASFDAMIKAAERKDEYLQQIIIQSPDKARMALRLLVAQARIDGRISESERQVIVNIADRLDIQPDEFDVIFKAGIQQADEVRKRRGL